MKADEVASAYFKHLERGQLLIDVERWREALHEFSQHLTAYPDDYHALCQSAFCFLRLKEYQRAYDSTKRAIEVSPETEWGYRLQSIIFTENREPKRALEAAKMCVQKAPHLWESHHCLYWAQVEYGDYFGAESTLTTLLQFSPDRSESHLAAAFLALKRNEYAEAERLYLEVLKLNPESINALNNLGTIYLHYAQTGKGRHYKQQSVDMFERAVKLQPTFKLGQQNITAASNALRFGLPAGGIFLVWGGIRLVSGLLSSFTDPAIPSYKRQSLRSDPANLISPSASSYLLTGTNIYFTLILTAIIVTLFMLINRRFREVIAYELFTFRAWGILFMTFGTSLALYVYSMWFLQVDGTPFSGFGLGISFLVVLYSGISLIRIRNTRQQLRNTRF
jgi:tetratricopeptide (TPR) repeat protein